MTNDHRLQWNISVLLWRVLIAFSVKHLECSDQFWPSHSRLDHLINEAALRCNVRRCELLAKLVRAPFSLCLRAGSPGDLAAIQNANRAFRSHHRNLGRGIREVHVGPYVLACHHTVSPAVSLACNHSNLRYCRFGKCEQQLRAVTNDAAVLLLDSRQKAGHVFKSDERYIEAVAEANKPRGLD